MISFDTLQPNPNSTNAFDKYTYQHQDFEAMEGGKKITYMSGKDTMVVIGYGNGCIEIRDLEKQQQILFPPLTQNEDGERVILCEILSAQIGGAVEFNILSVHANNQIILRSAMTKE